MASYTSATIKGLNEWNAWAKLTPEEIERRVDKELKRSGASVQGNAKQLAPVDTGKLRSSIDTEMKVSPNLRQVFIFSSLYYAAYQEYGTIKNKAQPYLIPSFNQELGVYENNMRRALMKGLD